MSETMKAVLKFIFAVARSAAGAAMTAMSTADGPNAFKRPYVWLGMIVAVEPVVSSYLTPTVGQARKMDEKIEEKAQAKAEVKIQSLISTGSIPRHSGIQD